MDKVVHFEIPADDVERAQKFYQEIFGWQIQKVPMPEMEYFIITTVETDEDRMPKESGAINGGMMPRQVPGEQPVLVIDVTDINARLQAIEAAGGKVVLPVQQVGDMGLYARFRDPEGNIVGVWQNLK